MARIKASRADQHMCRTYPNAEAYRAWASAMRQIYSSQTESSGHCGGGQHRAVILFTDLKRFLKTRRLAEAEAWPPHLRNMNSASPHHLHEPRNCFSRIEANPRAAFSPLSRSAAIPQIRGCRVELAIVLRLGGADFTTGFNQLPSLCRLRCGRFDRQSGAQEVAS